ncbi:MAG: DUF502 domain-containing protein [Maricaulaceae bacterium]
MAKSEEKKSLFRSIRNGIITGIIVVLPVAATITFISWIVTGVDGFVLRYLPTSWNPENFIGVAVPGIGLLIGLMGLWVLGTLASNFIGRSVIGFGERIVSRVPLVSNIYGALKQIVNVVAAQKDTAFQEVCLIEYPRPGLWAVGFITADLKGAPREHLDDGHVCVFVPTTPNPTSGFLLFSQKNDLKVLDMTPEEGVKLIISGGMVASNEEGIVAASQNNRPRLFRNKKDD